MPELTLADLAREMEDVKRLLAAKVRQGESLEAWLMILSGRLSDPTRVTIAEAVEMERRLRGKGSRSGVRKKIEAGVYTLEKRPGEKEGRIPIEQIYDEGYLPIGVWRAALAAQKRGR